MLVEEMLSHIPSDWSYADYSNTPFSAVQLTSPFSDEFKYVKAMFETGEYFGNIRNIFRVQNPLLWVKFLLRKDLYDRNGETDIKTLYHDTSQMNINSICTFNFDWRKGQRHMFGPGVYFSTRPNTACKHSTKSNGPWRAMFLVDVITQNIQYGDKNIFLPDLGFDTVVAHGGSTYVKYFDSEYYPRYFATYELNTNGFL